MGILLKVAATCFVLAVVSYVLLKVMLDSMNNDEKAMYIWNDIAPKRVTFFAVCLWIFSLAVCISLIGVFVMM